jgi:hypothetical protein
LLLKWRTMWWPALFYQFYSLEQVLSTSSIHRAFIYFLSHLQVGPLGMWDLRVSKESWQVSSPLKFCSVLYSLCCNSLQSEFKLQYFASYKCLLLSFLNTIT